MQIKDVVSFKDTKTEDIRVIGLGAEALAALEVHRKQQEKFREKSATARNWRGGGSNTTSDPKPENSSTRNWSKCGRLGPCSERGGTANAQERAHRRTDHHRAATG